MKQVFYNQRTHIQICRYYCINMPMKFIFECEGLRVGGFVERCICSVYWMPAHCLYVIYEMLCTAYNIITPAIWCGRRKHQVNEIGYELDIIGVRHVWNDIMGCCIAFEWIWCDGSFFVCYLPISAKLNKWNVIEMCEPVKLDLIELTIWWYVEFLNN